MKFKNLLVFGLLILFLGIADNVAFADYATNGGTTGGGGGGTPGGSFGQVQYNSAGSFGGFTVSGDATLNTGTGALTLSNTGVSANTYTNVTITVDAKGRITSASTGSSGNGNQMSTGSFSSAGSATAGFNFCDATSAGFVLTLPTAIGVSGQIIEIKKVDSSSNLITVTPTGIQTIDGASTYSLSTYNQVVSLISDGSNWKIK